MTDGAQTRVLIVEDQECNRMMMREHVAMAGCIPVLAADGVKALEEIHASAPDAVILDLSLPRLDGVSVLKRIRENPEFRRMPIMVISAATELNQVRRCIDLGASDFLPKPFPAQTLRSRLRYCLDRRETEGEDEKPFQARKFAREIVSSLGALGMATKGPGQDWSGAVLELVERFAPETRVHLGRASAFCRVLTQQLARDRRFGGILDETFIDDFSRTAGLHDIGKLAIPDSILEKPGPLDADEHRIMRRHVTVGAEILREVYSRFPHEHRFEMAIDLTLYHHERWDGLGYPFGLSGHVIPLVGRIMAVADVYDALRSERCYKAAFSHEMSRDIILAGSGKQFDPAVVAGFLACEKELDRLFHGNMAAAVQTGARLTPRRESAPLLPLAAAAS